MRISDWSSDVCSSDLMEAAALYAFGEARHKPVLCFAHVTNQMGLIEGGFEKGEANGTRHALDVISVAARTWRRVQAPHSSSIAEAVWPTDRKSTRLNSSH